MKTTYGWVTQHLNSGHEYILKKTLRPNGKGGGRKLTSLLVIVVYEETDKQVAICSLWRLGVIVDLQDSVYFQALSKACVIKFSSLEVHPCVGLRKWERVQLLLYGYKLHQDSTWSYLKRHKFTWFFLNRFLFLTALLRLTSQWLHVFKSVYSSDRFWHTHVPMKLSP